MTANNPSDTESRPVAPPLTPAAVRDDGLRSALAAALDRDRERREGATVAGGQLPLIPVAVDDDEAEPANQEARGGGRGGRPKGSRNRSTEAWREFLGNRYRSPLEVMAEIYSRSVGELVAEIGCTKLEALTLQLRAAAESAPYWHQKQPMAMQIDGKGIVQLVLEAPSQQPAPIENGRNDLVLEARIVSEENQPLSSSEKE
jgi:hypothetical protein